MYILTTSNEEYALIAGDLMRAASFLALLRATDVTPDSKTVREALTLAAIVSYCRPFKHSRPRTGRSRPWIPSALIDDLSSDERTVHERIVWARDRAWAHTDWVAHEVRSTGPREPVPIVVGSNPWVPMDDQGAAQFALLLKAVNRRVRPDSVVSIDASSPNS